MIQMRDIMSNLFCNEYFRIFINWFIDFPEVISELIHRLYIFVHAELSGIGMGNHWWIESGGRVTEEESALVISETYRSDEGYYMCKARNKFGVAMSKTTRLWQAVLGAFDPTLKEVVYNVDEYKPLTVTCFTPKVAPNATYSWSIVESQVDNAPRKLILDKRIQIDDKGEYIVWWYLMNVSKTRSERFIN